jgi:hypothetical protein
MTKLVRWVAVASLVFGSVRAAAAQTVDEIIEKHLAASGGRAALGKLTSRVITGTFTVSTPAGEFSGPIEITNQAPNKLRTLITLDLAAVGVGKVTIDQRFDGVTGYAIDTLQGNRDITGDQLEAMRNGIFPSPLLDYKATGLTLELTGKEKVGDREVYLVVMKPKTGPSAKMYIDATTFMMVRQVASMDVPPVGLLEQTTDLSDEREVDGIKVPHKITSTSSVQNFTVTVTKVVHNVAVDPMMFVKPAN